MLWQRYKVKPLSRFFEFERFFDLRFGSTIIGCQLWDGSPTFLSAEQECCRDSGIHQYGHSERNIWVNYHGTWSRRGGAHVLFTGKREQNLSHPFCITLNSF